MIDVTTVKVLSKKFEIDSFTILRECLQVHLLDKLFKESTLKNTYFKGGTCLRLVFGSSRFSEDLDFTTFEPKDKVERIIKKAVKDLSFELPDISAKDLKTLQGFSYKIYLPTEISEQPLTVRLDFSKRESVIEPMVSPIETSFPVLTTVVVDHLSQEEILAEKVRAITKREKGRDLFDLWFLLSKGVTLDEEFIGKKLEFYKENFNLKKLIKKIEEWEEKDIDNDLRRFLPVSERRIIPELKRLVLSKLQGAHGTKI